MTVAFEQFQNRRDTAANWTAKNPILLAGELGLEIDTNLFKFGDGITAWNSLQYAQGGVVVLPAGSPYPNPAPPAGILVLRLL